MKIQTILMSVVLATSSMAFAQTGVPATRDSSATSRIAHAEISAKSDGKVGMKERKHSARMGSHPGRAIHRQKHDGHRAMRHPVKHAHHGGYHHTLARRGDNK